MGTVEAAGLSIGDGHPPRIMGVLNLSPESPYDPSVFDDPDEATEYIEEDLIAAGADVVDVGLESANKRFEVRDPEWELDRLDLAIETIERVEDDVVFSIETRYHEVAAEALDRGFDMVNDICGFADPGMPRVCRERNAAVVKMASPPDLHRPGALESVEEIYQALKRGELTDKTIIDPAFGGWSQGKTTDLDRETFRRLREFRALDRPILVSINRKNFIREIADRSTDDALAVSLGGTAMAVERGADLIRTHDVAETRDAALIGQAFSRDLIDTETVTELDITTEREAKRHLSQFDIANDVAGECVGRAFGLTDVDSNARDRLLDAAAGTGLVAVVSQERGFLGGPTAAVSRLSERLEDLPEIRAAIEAAIDR